MIVKKKSRLKKWEPFDFVVLAVLTLFALIVFYPFYNSIISSVSSAKEYALNPAMLFPKKLVLKNYQYILTTSNLLNGYKNSIFLVLVGVPFSMLVTVAAAYAFSRKQFPGKRLFFMLALFTMFFNGGLVPIYLNMKSLHLTNSLFSIIFHYGIATYYLIIIKTTFEQIPDSLEEAAKMDGANDVTIFFRVMLPLVLPTLATFGLFFTVDRWNEWYYGMIFIRDAEKQPLQLILRNLISQTNQALSVGVSVDAEVYDDGVKMAAVVVTMLPVMVVYPFLQKYFVKGIMVGAVKQ